MHHELGTRERERESGGGQSVSMGVKQAAKEEDLFLVPLFICTADGGDDSKQGTRRGAGRL